MNEPRNETLYTSDVFNVLFEYEISRIHRYPGPVALMEIEMSAASSSNEALAQAEQIFIANLNEHLRSVDISSKFRKKYRIMLPSTNEAGAVALCERLLSVFQNKFKTPNGYVITFSLNIGAAAHAGRGELASAELQRKASAALEESKNKGANTYVVYEA
ncbi:MAG: hypothetical protein Fur002_01320 [Anaerolineales bacterium]